MAAPVVVAASAAVAWDTDGNVSPALPAGHASGHLLLLPIFVRNGAQTIDLTSGYTLVSGADVTGTATTAEIQGKVDGGSESAPTVTSSQTASQPTGAVLVAISGWSGTLGDLVISTAEVAGSATMVAPAAVTPVDDCLVLRIFLNADDNAVVTPPASHSLVISETTTLGSDAGLHVYSQTQAVAGDTGTASLVVGGSDAYIAWTLVVPPAAGGATDLVSANAAHGHTGASPSLTQVHEVASAGSTHGQAAAAPALTQAHILACDNAAHGHTGASPALTQVHQVAAASALHGHTATTVDLTGAGDLVPDSATHGHTAAAPALTQLHVLAANSAAHGQLAAEALVTTGSDLVSVNAAHGQTAGSPALTQVHQVTADSAAHGQSAVTVTLAQLHALIAANAAHGHTATQSSVTTGDLRDLRLTLGQPATGWRAFAPATGWRTGQPTT